MVKKTLTDLGVERAGSAPEGKRVIHWDTLAGFGLLVTDKGNKSWLVQTRLNGKTIKVNLGVERRAKVGHLRG